MLHNTRAEPNLVPILDMVFQLITFFMLVVNFKGAETDQSLELPVLGSARPVDTKGDENLLVLNIDAQGRLKVYGATKDVKTYIASEARNEADKLALRTKGGFERGAELPTTVVIRADKGIPFNLLYDIVRICQENGYRKFSLKALSQREER
jgi:biopolymer transport protein ExbD